MYEGRMYGCTKDGCTMYDVRCTKEQINVQRTDVRCTKEQINVRRTDVRCTMYDVRCTMYNVRRTKDGCTMYEGIEHWEFVKNRPSGRFLFAFSLFSCISQKKAVPL